MGLEWPDELREDDDKMIASKLLETFYSSAKEETRQNKKILYSQM